LQFCLPYRVTNRKVPFQMFSSPLAKKAILSSSPRYKQKSAFPDVLKSLSQKGKVVLVNSTQPYGGGGGQLRHYTTSRKVAVSIQFYGSWPISSTTACRPIGVSHSAIIWIFLSVLDGRCTSKREHDPNKAGTRMKWIPRITDNTYWTWPPPTPLRGIKLCPLSVHQRQTLNNIPLSHL
jgi:hypothetical protein